jgi:hypothetical protein
LMPAAAVIPAPTAVDDCGSSLLKVTICKKSAQNSW